MQKRLDAIPEASDGTALRVHAEGELICPYWFSNPLPEVPVDPKLLVHHIDKEALIRYRYDSVMETAQRYELLAEPDLGIAIDLVDPSVYEAAPGATLAPEDQELLTSAATHERSAPSSMNKSAVTKQMRNKITWLRKTQLMGNNLYEATHKHPKEHVERDSYRKSKKESSALVTAGSGSDPFRRKIGEIVDVIEQSFADVEKLGCGQIKHPTNAALKAEAVLPVLPDFDCWENSYVQMQFDFDPGLEHAASDKSKLSRKRLAQGIVKGQSTPARDGQPAQRYVAYLLPKSEPVEGAGAYAEGEMEWVREYAYTVSRDDGNAPYFFVVRDGSVVYNEIEKQMNLSRKPFCEPRSRPSEVFLKRRELEPAEQEEHSARRQKLTSNLLRLTHTSEGA